MYYIEKPIDSFMICDANVDLGNKDNRFDVFSGNDNNFVSLC